MKTQNYFAFLMIFFTVTISQAQYVTIPDTNFVAWLNANGYTTCMNGSMMDTTCPAVINATKISCMSQNITGLTGVQYFDNLDTLYCGGNNIDTLPELNEGLLALDCASNEMSVITNLPSTIIFFNCRSNELFNLPDLPDSLKYLNCDFNNLSVLPSLPPLTEYISCYGNQLIALPSLPPLLVDLACHNNSLNSLPPLPSGLINLSFGNNLIGNIPALPSTLKILSCSSNQLTTLPALPDSLLGLYCNSNSISTLPALPMGLKNINCSNNQLTALPALPDSLLQLNCRGNSISIIPVLPGNINLLNCSDNLLTSLPALPNSLETIICFENQIASFPQYPTSLEYLDCGTNLLTSLPSVLPSSLKYFYCANNLLVALPNLNPGLINLNCTANQLTLIPSLPQGLVSLAIGFNQISNLPSLPFSLFLLECNNNPITFLPALPDTFGYLSINNCPISCLPEMTKLTTLYWTGSNITCLPNYINITNATPSISTLGLCQPSGNCPTFWNISGNIYKDANANCMNDLENNLSNVSVLLDSAGINIQQFLTNIDGNFSFRAGFGTYEVKVDTTSLPFNVTCPLSFNNTSVLATGNAYDSLANFALECKPGFDLIAQSITPNANFRPGAFRTVKINAGENSFLYGTQCNATFGGTVQLILNGPVSFYASVANAITPSIINGDTLTWIVSNFSLTDPNQDYNFTSEVSTSATIGDTLCFDLIINPSAGDSNPANNIYSACFAVVNSFDPNEKSMTPSGIVDTSQQWFDFTIFFQNTGNAPAEDIYILDSLQNTLDANTFSFVSSSHDVITQMLPGNVLRFNFADINLIDSTSNEPESHGFVRFKIKRKQLLPVGTIISNTSYIYFDYNPPIVTNTVSATLSLNVGIEETDFPIELLSIFPSPATSELTIQYNGSTWKNISLELFNVYGQRVRIIHDGIISSGDWNKTIDVSDLASGIYFIKSSGMMSEVKRFVKY